MISAYISEDSGYRISLKGHADYMSGNDIVCASVSALVFSLIGYLENSEDESADYITEEGYADIFCSEASKEALRMFAIGLLQIENSYPANLSVKCEINL